MAKNDQTPGLLEITQKVLIQSHSNESTEFYKIRPVGFEPTTLGSEDRCAIQLRHGRGCSYQDKHCWILFQRTLELQFFLATNPTAKKAAISPHATIRRFRQSLSSARLVRARQSEYNRGPLRVSPRKSLHLGLRLHPGWAEIASRETSTDPI